jgi:hypothetical protein
METKYEAHYWFMETKYEAKCAKYVIVRPGVDERCCNRTTVRDHDGSDGQV